MDSKYHCSDNGFVSKRWQIIIWPNDGFVNSSVSYASPGLIVLLDIGFRVSLFLCKHNISDHNVFTTKTI